MAKDNPQSGAMKTAHVLFMDIVGYSKLPIDEQTSARHILQEIVRGTAEVAFTWGGGSGAGKRWP